MIKSFFSDRFRLFSSLAAGFEGGGFPLLLFAGLVDGLDGLGRLVVLHRAFACCSALLPGLGRFFYFYIF